MGTGIELLSVNEHGDLLSPGMRVGSVWSNALDTKIDVVWGTATTAQAPPSWHQSYQRPSADAVCEAGWSPSWALWPAGGLGGFVCNKEIYWSMATGGWSTRSKALR